MRRDSVSRRSGFAIILTLVLMAFAVMLITAFATLARLGGIVSDHGIEEKQARQNARMALTVALAQLQRCAGPDARVTATAAAFGGNGGNAHCTGVWDSLTSDAAPHSWLVSGSESGSATLPDGSTPSVELVGLGSSSASEEVMAPLQAITSSRVPGISGTTTVGKYAWWVGDEGVKASVGLADRTDQITYAPFDSIELRSRIHQQCALVAGPADSNGQSVFESRDSANATALNRTLQFNQVASLPASGSSTGLGHSGIRGYFHSWTTNHEAVLTNSKSGGLRKDLSLQPELLGSAYASWADTSTYMENPSAGIAPMISPAYPASAPAESLRRRYRMVSPQSNAGVAQGVTPVLSYLILTFNFRTDQSVSGSTRPLEVRARWLATLWNPYTSALVPEDLQLEVSGLPNVTVFNDTVGSALPLLSLDSLYGAPLRISLPWTPSGRDDQQSWFPGRVHSWSAKEDLNKASAVPSSGFASIFFTRTMSTTAGQGVQRAVPALTMANSAQGHLQGTATQLSLRLYRVGGGGTRELLGTSLSPMFNAFSTTPAAINAATYQFTYVLRLAESLDSPANPDWWLTTAGQDMRESEVPGSAYLSGANGPRPELYPNYTSASFPDRLLDRALPASAGSTTGQSYNEDTPLFELPRGPILSIGALQHLHTVGTRPWAIGNSWGDAGGWNRLFDQYFYSGLASGVDVAAIPFGAPLPNPLLQLAGRKSDGMKPSITDVVAQSSTGLSSKFLRQSGAFNINSVDPLAWLAVLRSGRSMPDAPFTFLDAKTTTGTAADVKATAFGFGDAVFYRFPYSAQETYKATDGFAASTTEPPASPNTASMANTHLFRHGVRALTVDQSLALANAIVERVRQRQAASGPFRCIEEFLAPSPLFGGRNALEAAIENTTGRDGKLLNDPSSVAEFSSQWLTSGDVMTALAPILVARSDTFLIRTYGEVINPVTSEREARAWLEARVQRTVDYVDASQPPETDPGALNLCNQTYGRRFRIVSFRWLDRSDI